MSSVRNYEAISSQVVETQPEVTETQPQVVDTQPQPEPTETRSGPIQTFFPLPEHLRPAEPRESLCLKVCKPCCMCASMFACVAEVCFVLCDCRDL